MIADVEFHDSIFQVKKKLEHLAEVFKTRQETFSMPPCHASCKVITGWIHSVRAQATGTPAQTAGLVAAAISTAATANALGSRDLTHKSKVRFFF